jgi:hypothetical protein
MNAATKHALVKRVYGTSLYFKVAKGPEYSTPVSIAMPLFHCRRKSLKAVCMTALIRALHSAQGE